MQKGRGKREGEIDKGKTRDAKGSWDGGRRSRDERGSWKENRIRDGRYSSVREK